MKTASKRAAARICASLLTVLLTAGALFVAARTFRRTYSEFKYRPFFSDKTEYDVLFFGTSHVVFAVYPMQLWHDWGITSYNFGTYGAPIPLSYWIMRNAVRHHKPKVAVLDVHTIGFNRKTNAKEWIHHALDTFPPSPTKLLTLRDLFDLQDGRGGGRVRDPTKLLTLRDLFDTAPERVKYLFPYETYHNRWREMTLAERWDTLFRSDATTDKGAEVLTKIAVPPDFPRTDSPLEKETLAMGYARLFVSFCRKNGIVPVLMSVPFPANEGEQREVNSASLLAEELGVPYYNMLGMDIVDYDTDCSDPQHLNVSGGRKVTDFIGRTLAGQIGAGGGIFDRRGDPAYAEWDEDYEEFRKSRPVITENFKTSLMLLSCNTDRYSLRFFLEEGEELDRVERKLVAQLGNAVTVEHVPKGTCSTGRRGVLRHVGSGVESDLVWDR